MDNKIQVILKQSFKMYRKYGIKSVSMDDIAKACGISKKTLYENVKDKRQLVHLVTKIIIDEFGGNAEFESQNTAIDALFWSYKNVLKFAKEYNFAFEYDLQKYYPDLFHGFQKQLRTIKYDIMYQNLILGQKEGVYREDLDVNIVCKIHILSVEMLIKTDIFEEDSYTDVDIFREFFLYQFNAVATEKGKEKFRQKVLELENN